MFRYNISANIVCLIAGRLNVCYLCCVIHSLPAYCPFHSLPIKIYNYATSRFSVPQAVTASKVIYYIQAHSLP